MRTFTVFLLMAVLAGAPVVVDARDGVVQATAVESVRATVDDIPLLAEVSVRLADGSRVTGFLVEKAADTITIRPKRGKGSDVRVSLGTITSVKMKRQEQGLSAGRAIAIGVVAGTVTFLGLLYVLLHAAAGA